MRFKQLAVTFAFLVLSLGVIAANAGAAGANPFTGSPAEKPNPKKTVPIIVGTGVLLSQEQTLPVKAIWEDLKSSHSYSEDGEIVEGLSGAALTNTPDIIAAFYRYINGSPQSKEITVTERCSVCKGSGVIMVYPEDFASRLSPTRTVCQDCAGSGKMLVDVTYMLICPAERLPPKPKSPRQNKQEALEAMAKKGDLKARLEVALQFKEGAPLVTRDTEKAKTAYFEIARDGYVDGLQGYLEILKQSETLPQERKFQLAMREAIQSLRDKTPFTSDVLNDQETLYLDQLQTRIMASRLLNLFEGKALQRKHLTYSGLVAALTFESKPSFKDVVVAWMQQARDSRFDLEMMAKLKKFAESNDPGAFAVLGAISERGLHESVNMQAAHIFYSIAERISNSTSFRSHIMRVAPAVDPKLSDELLEDFEKSKVNGHCSGTFLNAVSKIQKNAK